MSPEDVTKLIVDGARRAGFHRVGVAAIDAPTRYKAYRAWLAAGYGGAMAYLCSPFQLAARRDLRALADDARSVAVVGLAYAPDAGGGDAFVARYARGQDYHTVLRRKLTALADELGAALGRRVAARPCVDSAPVLERDLAEGAGLGFVGKNTMLIAPGLGSYLVLGELLLDVDAAPTPGFDRQAPRCGDCRACLDACPTGAFVDAHVLDARRCISYLTIEYRGPIPRELRPAMGAMVFGCDVCQEVCPYNAAAPARSPHAPELAPSRALPSLIEILEMGAHQTRRLLEGSAMRRASRHQLRRNVCVALGNAGDARALPALRRALADRHPLVRGHAAWALGRLGDADALRDALDREQDPYVRSELTAAVSDCDRDAASARAR